jgi:predicted secreted Zn-dependent protease
MRKLFLLCFLAITRTSSAEVNESLVYTYYIANADPTRSLLSILNASSPIRQNGQVFHAHTSWYVDWNFRWFENPDGRCRITKVTTGLTGSISLPRLVDATPMQGRQFDIYLSTLRVHELGHYGIGKEAAAAIDRKILSLPEMPSCKALESAANDLGYRTLNEYKEKEVRYDASTAHGKSQGAWLDRVSGR